MCYDCYMNHHAACGRSRLSLLQHRDPIGDGVFPTLPKITVSLLPLESECSRGVPLLFPNAPVLGQHQQWQTSAIACDAMFVARHRCRDVVRRRRSVLRVSHWILREKVGVLRLLQRARRDHLSPIHFSGLRALRWHPVVIASGASVRLVLASHSVFLWHGRVPRRAYFFCGPAWLLQISTGAFQAQAGSLSCRKQLPPKSILSFRSNTKTKGLPRRGPVQMKNTVSPPPSRKLSLQKAP